MYDDDGGSEEPVMGMMNGGMTMATQAPSTSSAPEPSTNMMNGGVTPSLGAALQNRRI